MYIGNYNVASYVEYLSKFCNQPIDQILKNKVKAYLDCETRKDMFVSALIKVSKARYESGISIERIELELRDSFDFFELNDRISYDEYKFFINGAIDSSLLNMMHSQDTPKEELVSNMLDIISEFNKLNDSYYKANMALSILRIAMNPQIIVALPNELISISDYLKLYDLEDMQTQHKLNVTFSLFS